MTDAKIYEYTQKQKWLEWLRIEIITQYQNNIDITLLNEKNAIISHVYNKFVNNEIYSKDFTLAFLNENYYKIMREILTINEREQKKQDKLQLQKQKAQLEYEQRFENVNNTRVKYLSKVACTLLIIPLTILYTLIFMI